MHHDVSEDEGRWRMELRKVYQVICRDDDEISSNHLNLEHCEIVPM